MASLAGSPDLFLDNEKRAFDGVAREIAAGEVSVFALRCRNVAASADLAETIATAYLLSNAIFMSRSRRRIAKLLSLDIGEEVLRFGFANNFRALFDSRFSSLENVDLWRRMLEDRQHISVGALADASKAVEFFRHAEISSTASEFHRAHVHVGIEGVAAADPMGGQFMIDDANRYAPALRGVGASAVVALKSVFLADALKVRTGRRGQNIVIELDCARADRGITSWFESMDRILALDFYRLGL